MLSKAIPALGLCLFLATGLCAQDTKQESTDKTTTEKVAKKKGNKGKGAAKRKAKIIRQITNKDFGAVELTEEQKSKLETLVDEKFAKLSENQKAMDSIVPKDKRKSRTEAFKAARAEGKKYKEAVKIGLEAIGLSEEDQTKIAELGKAKKELMDSIRTGVSESLSQDQKSKIAEAKKASRKAGKGNKKKDGETKTSDDSVVSVKVSLPGMT